jgi:hypothetical protein
MTATDFSLLGIVLLKSLSARIFRLHDLDDKIERMFRKLVKSHSIFVVIFFCYSPETYLSSKDLLFRRILTGEHHFVGIYPPNTLQYQ